VNVALEQRRRTLLGYAVAFLAAASYGAANVISRQNLDEVAPLVGSLVSLGFGTLGLVALSARHLGGVPADGRRGVLFYSLAGICSTGGIVCLFLALERAPVVMVTPVSNTYPLMTLLLAAVFLRGIERLTPRLFLGAALVVAGVIVLTLA
jgi:drug/metabolite transporter (DMT)-like permease